MDFDFPARLLQSSFIGAAFATSFEFLFPLGASASAMAAEVAALANSYLRSFYMVL